MNVADRIRAFTPPLGGLGLFWLGNSGCALRLDNGAVVYIDPLLSDTLLRVNNWERLLPVPFAPAEADCDLVLITHAHPDHCDPQTLPELARVTKAHFTGPPAVCKRLTEWDIAPERIHQLGAGGHFDWEDVRVEATRAFHVPPRAPMPDATGLVLKYKGLSVYHAGDTMYMAEVRDSVAAAGPLDLALLPINGKRCCMGPEDAAFMADDLKPRVVVPIHYGIFAENNSDPLELLLYLRRYRVAAQPVVLPFLGGLTLTAETHDMAVL